MSSENKEFGTEVSYILDFVRSWKPSRVLEVGCNFGRELKAIEGLTQIYGVDKDPENIKKAKSYVPTGTFKVAEGESLPFEDNFFDLVYTDGCLSHNPPEKVAKILSEIVRVGKGHILTIEYLGTRQSADTYSNCKKTAWIHDYDRLYFPLKVDIYFNQRISSGLDVYQIILSRKMNRFEDKSIILNDRIKSIVSDLMKRGAGAKGNEVSNLELEIANLEGQIVETDAELTRLGEGRTNLISERDILKARWEDFSRKAVEKRLGELKETGEQLRSEVSNAKASSEQGDKEIKGELQELNKVTESKYLELSDTLKQISSDSKEILDTLKRIFR